MTLLPLFVLSSFPLSLPARSELGMPTPAAEPEGAADFGGALRALALRELATATDALSAATPCSDEGMGQARRAIRRTRALLDLAHEVLGRDGDALDNEFKRLSQALADRLQGRPLVDALDALAMDLPVTVPQDPLVRFRQTALAARAARAGSDDDAADEAFHGRLVDLTGALAGLPWHTFEVAAALGALARSVERANAAGRRAVKGDKDPEWHHWRRRARRVWQQTQALEPLHPIAAGDLAEREALSRHLAAARHAAQIIAHCGDLSPFAEDDRRALLDFACEQLQHHRSAAIAVFAPHAVEPG